MVAKSGGLRRLALSVIYRLRKILPESRLGDRIFSFLDFSVRYRRLPGNRPLFHDALYRIKATREALDPLRVFVSDKELVKLYIRAIVGEQFNVPTIAVLRSPEDVDRFDFPAACCIKPTHASGKFIFRRNGGPIDNATIKGWFSINHYRVCREANYKSLTPKVIVEPLLFQGGDVLDYRFFLRERGRQAHCRRRRLDR